MATRQPSEDKELWHSEMEKEEIVGGAVSGADEEEEDEELELEPASSAGRLLEADEDDSPASSAGRLAELDEPADEDETAEEADKLETEAIPPSPPPPKPG